MGERKFASSVRVMVRGSGRAGGLSVRALPVHTVWSAPIGWPCTSLKPAVHVAHREDEHVHHEP